jgi:dTMP kinase
MVGMLPQVKPLPNGLVIIFEGVDGVGKTTQLKLVQETLEQAGWPVLATRNLGGTPVGEALREVLLSSVERPPLTDFYVSLAIQEPLLEVIDAARQEGKIVLLDRGPLSLAAYQMYGHDVDEALGWPQVENAMQRLQPEAVLLYDMDPALALERNRQHPEKASYFESLPLGYFEKVAAGFRTAAQRYSQVVTTIDAAQPIPVGQAQTLAVIAKLLA